MRHVPRWLGAGAILLALTRCFSAGAGSPPGAHEMKPVMPSSVFTEVVMEAKKKILDALDRKPNEKTTPALIRTNALVIALAAQDALGRDSASAPKFATLRAVALRLAAAAPAKKLNLTEAKKEADQLAAFPQLKADPAASTSPVALEDKFDLATAMKVFDKVNKGGHGLEAEFLTLEQQKRPYTPAQMSDKLVADAYKAALFGKLTAKQDVAAKDKKAQWQALSSDMEQAALQMAEAVEAKHAKEAKVAVKKLNASCTACHDAFR